MTKAEAIAILENFSSGARILMRDACEREKGVYTRHYAEQAEAANLGVAALREKAERDSSTPLTWEQIAERIGKPVCDCHGNDYRIVAWVNSESRTIVFTDGSTIGYQDGATSFYAHEMKHKQNDPLLLEQLRNLSTPCCLWLVADGNRAEPIIFNGVAKRSNSDEDIVKWISIQAHHCCASIYGVNSRLFFYLTEVRNA